VTPAPAPSAPSAEALFCEAERIETADRRAAEAAYRRALRADPAHACAAINLSALLCNGGHCAEALEVCDAALAHAPADALLLFNRAIALEDLGRVPEALAAYGQCLAQQPDFADAHFNAARLHHRLGQSQQALRHFNAYRRLS
jgi:tetratricopeptide (TPR) repeat protein